MTSESSINKTKILHVSHWFPSYKKPFLGNFTEQLIISLSEISNCYFLKNKNQNTARITKFGVKCIENLSKKRVVFFSRLSKLRFFIKTLRTQKFDIVHFHTTQQLIPEIVCALYFSKARVVLAEYGSYLVKPRFDQHSFLFKIAIRLVHKKVNALIVMSNFLKSELASNAAEKAIVIGNLIDDNWFERPIQRNESKDFYRFLHISTADENKNVEGIILACLILKTSGYTNFRTRIVSDESIIDLQELVKKLGLIDFVTFDGPIAHDQIGKVYQDADCFLLNSRIETFSIVAAEALCCGLHLISTPVGFVLDLSTDLYTKTEINNNESLAEAMKTAISKNKFNGYSGRLAVEQFKNSRIQAAYQQVYHNLQKQ